MPSDVSVTIRLGRHPRPEAESASPGLMLGRSSTSSPGFGAVVAVVGLPGVSVGVVDVDDGGGVVVVGAGVVVFGVAGVVVVPGRAGGVVTGGGGVVVTGGGGVVVGVVVVTPVTTNVPLAVCGWLEQVAVTV
ncbi:hypothetical protein ACWED2_00500 [Amycolatopsis sp. NPDC005003]